MTEKQAEEIITMLIDIREFCAIGAGFTQDPDTGEFMPPREVQIDPDTGKEIES